MNFPSEKDDWKNFVKNNVAIALNILYVRKKKHACSSNKKGMFCYI